MNQLKLMKLMVAGGTLALGVNMALVGGMAADSAAASVKESMIRSTDGSAYAGNVTTPSIAATTEEPARQNGPALEEECVHSQGFWRNHPEAWPVDELMLGTVLYSQDELLSILNNPPRGNGLVILARQLIAAKLNVEDGANTPEDIHDAIADADDLIGDLVVPPVGEGWIHPSETGELNDALAAYNDGERHDEDCEIIEPEDR